MATLLSRADELLRLREGSASFLSKDAGPEEDDFYSAAHELLPELVQELHRLHPNSGGS